MRKEKKVNGGRPNKLSNSDKLFIALSYLREYRPLQMIAFDYGVSETTIGRAIKEAEGIIVKNPEFRLPGKKALQNITHEFIVVNATEISIDRPKKNKTSTTQKNKKITL
ncbi:MAG: transposase family protein [Fusobacteria bacterium]|nr:transposase family protein [Fusobacteriota bacterium]